MKFNFLLPLLLILSCQSDNFEAEENSNIHSSTFSNQKKFEENYRGRDFHIKNTEHIFNTHTCDRTIFIELLYRDSAHGVIPYLLTKNNFGDTIDSLDLTTKPCYMGTDSWYYPLIEIKNNKTVIVTDSSYYTTHSGFETIQSENGRNVICPIGEQELYISEDKYQVNNDGTFSLPESTITTINCSDSTLKDKIILR